MWDMWDNFPRMCLAQTTRNKCNTHGKSHIYPH